MTIFLTIISGRSSTLPNDHPNITISEPYKHLRIAKAFMVRQIIPLQKRRFWVWSSFFGVFRPGFGFGQGYHLDRHGQLAIKQSRLSVLNETHTNSYTAPRLESLWKKESKTFTHLTLLLPIQSVQSLQYQTCIQETRSN